MPPVLPDVDRDLINRLLLRIESDAHRAGWDGPPALFALYDARDASTDQAYRLTMSGCGPVIRCHPYAAQPMAPRGGLDGYASHAVFRMALNMKAAPDDPRVAALIGMMRRPGFLGVALLCETWARQESEEGRGALGAVRFADIPGSVECRLVSAADVAGRDYMARRVRGRKPQAGEDFGSIEGSVFESLRVIVAAIANLPVPELTTPPSMWSWDEQETVW